MQLRRYPELDGKTFLICVGAMKTATSWVYAHLAKTSRVAVSPLKEVHFFSAKFTEHALYDVDLLAMKRLAFHIGQTGNPVENLTLRPTFQASVDRARMIYDDNAYFEHFAHLAEPDTRVLADLTPAYGTIGEAGFRFMADACASQDMSVKILFILRDPVQRLWSHMRFLPQLDPEFDPMVDWKARLQDPATRVRSDYKGTIEALERVFPTEDVLILFYEDLFEGGFADLCGRLNLLPPEIDVGRRYNETKEKLELPERAAQAFRAELEPQYEYCRRRFGDALPSAWAK